VNTTELTVTIKSTEHCKVTVTIRSSEHCRVAVIVRDTEHCGVTLANMTLSRQFYQFVY